MELKGFLESFNYFIQLAALWDYMPCISLSDFECGLLDSDDSENNYPRSVNSFISDSHDCTGEIINNSDYSFLSYADFNSPLNGTDKMLCNYEACLNTAQNAEYITTVIGAVSGIPQMAFTINENRESLSQPHIGEGAYNFAKQYKSVYENAYNGIVYAADMTQHIAESMAGKTDIYSQCHSMGINNSLLSSYYNNYNSSLCIGCGGYSAAAQVSELGIMTENTVSNTSMTSMENYLNQLNCLEAPWERDNGLISEKVDNYSRMWTITSTDRENEDTSENYSSENSSYILSEYRKNELLKAAVIPAAQSGGDITVNVDFKAYADIKNNYDIEKFANVFVKRLEAELSSCAEGIHF